MSLYIFKKVLQNFAHFKCICTFDYVKFMIISNSWEQYIILRDNNYNIKYFNIDLFKKKKIFQHR